ncbi:hypothetical protein BV20DRAFT_999049 [Pilatotrama ljubarskyi]|nr:hypothetical protein BV20DRAFT_999049 [Pilatotrama ljubarskyi]
MVETRRKAHTKAAYEHEYILRLPSELLRMIVECLEDEDRSWLASLATLSKTLMPEVEAVLYRDIEVGKCRNASIACRSVVKRPHRAVAVRKLCISLRGGTSIKQHLKRALQALPNVFRLELVVDDPSLFEFLLDVPFRLQVFIAGGECYPECFEDILASQPSIEFLSLVFVGAGTERTRREISRPDILPNLRSLSVAAVRYPFSLIKRAFPITHLSLSRARHDDLAHAMKLFGGTLRSLTALRFLDSACTDACYWPTSIFRNAHLPQLRYVDVTDFYDPTTDLFGHTDDIVFPGLGQACPALKTLIWGVDGVVMDDLYMGTLEVLDPDATPMEQYARTIFDALPALQRFVVYDTEEMARGARWEPYGEVFRRAEDKSVSGPDTQLIDFLGWKGESLAEAK